MSVVERLGARLILQHYQPDPLEDELLRGDVLKMWSASTQTNNPQGFGALSEKAPGDTNREAPLHLPGVCDPAALFDALIAQQDRHMTNYRWDGATLGLLDNAYAFAALGDSPTTGRPYHGHASVFVAQRQAQGRSALEQTELDALDRLINNAAFLGDLGLILLPEQFDALNARAAKMLQTGHLLDILEF